MRQNNINEKRKRMRKGAIPPAARRAARRRIRPAARAAARRARAANRPMPAPPPRRPLRRPAKPLAKSSLAAAPNPELLARVEGLQSQFASLESKAQLPEIYHAIGRFETQLVELPLALEALRHRGYVHSEQLEDRLEAMEEKWDDVRPRVESALKEHTASLDKQLDEVERHVHTLRPAEPALRAADSVMNSLSQRIGTAESAVSALYSGMESELTAVESDLNRITGLMDLLEKSDAIQLRETEGPLMAVKTEWQRDGKEGPEGILFLTDQRLLFEQREEVVTKKTLGIFKSESKTIQELLIEVESAHIESVKGTEEGGFLGMGKEDILEFVFTAAAPLSRARFHLKGQDSSDWSAMIKRIQSGDIDADRAQEYMDELEEAQAASAAFPTECPKCFAAVPTPPRGVPSVTCEYCGAIITPSMT